MRRFALLFALLAACAEEELTEDLAASAGAVTIPVETTWVFSELPELELTSVRVYASPNQPRSFYGRFVARLDQDAPPGKLMAAGRVICYSGDTVHSYASTSQNIWVNGDQVTLVARLLFAPAVAGEYDCKLMARVGKLDPGHYLTYLGGPGKTELIYSSPTWGKNWGAGNDSKHPGYWEDIEDPETGETKRYDYVAATHIHSDITTRSIDGSIIGNSEYVAKGNNFVLPAGPSSFNAFASIHMTSCFEGDTSCFWGARTQGGPAASTTSVVDLSIIVTQVRADGSLCVRDPGPVKRVTIQGDSHHQTAQLALNNIPVNSCGGSRRFNLKVLATRVSGNPIRIERGDLDPTDPSQYNGYTHLDVYY